MVGMKTADLETTLFEAPGGRHLVALAAMVGLYHLCCRGILRVGDGVWSDELDVQLWSCGRPAADVVVGVGLYGVHPV